jgi:hypothetical protein
MEFAAILGSRRRGIRGGPKNRPDGRSSKALAFWRLVLSVFREVNLFLLMDEDFDVEIVEEGIHSDRTVLPQSQIRRDRIVPKSTAKRPRSFSDSLAEGVTKKAKVSTGSPEERLQDDDFKGHSFYIREASDGKKELRCKLCRIDLDHTRKDSLKKHITSKGHLQELSEKSGAASTNSSLLDYGVAVEKVPVGSGGTLPVDHKKWRIRIVETFLKAGIPLSKVDDLRQLLEEFSPFSLTSSSNLYTYIPAIVEAQDAFTKAILQGKFVVFLFDGTPHLGELVAVIARFWHKGRVHQRLIHFVHLAKTPTAEELVQVRNFYSHCSILVL